VSDRVARGTPDPLEHADAIRHCPTDPRGLHDAGAAGRIEPCLVRTWCVLSNKHEGNCVEVPRYAIAATSYGPKSGRK
jgi:hypothetical protein